MIKAVLIYSTFMMTAFLPVMAKAKCASEYMRAIPENASIPPNALLVIEGYGDNEKDILELSADDISLQSKNEKMPVSIIERYEGRKGVAQIVINPLRPLKSGQKYTLSIKEKSTDEYKQAASYSVETAALNSKPQWRSQPDISKRTYEELGCGPEDGIEVNTPVIGEGTLFIEVELKAIDPKGTENKPVVYLIPVKDDRIFIGHDMCYGPFAFQKNHEYEATLTLRDVTGNQNPDNFTIRFKI